MDEMISSDMILSRIYYIRGHKVMLDKDLAELYGVETKQLKRQVRRNIGRFPDDFMFELTEDEFQNLRCHFGISNSGEAVNDLRSQFATSRWGGTRYPPMAFTEQGVYMLSSVLNSQRAILVNIQIVRAFVRIRQMISSHEDLRKKIEAMEEKYDGQFRIVFDAIRELLRVESRPKKKIGFKTGE
jgi:hypothetical protein